MGIAKDLLDLVKVAESFSQSLSSIANKIADTKWKLIKAEGKRPDKSSVGSTGYFEYTPVSPGNSVGRLDWISPAGTLVFNFRAYTFNLGGKDLIVKGSASTYTFETELFSKGMKAGKYIAVHQTPGLDGFTITHVPTGLTLRSNIPKSKATKMGKALADMGDLLSFSSREEMSSEVAQKIKMTIGR